MDAEEEGWIKYFSCSLFLTRGGYETNIERSVTQTEVVENGSLIMFSLCMFENFHIFIKTKKQEG